MFQEADQSCDARSVEDSRVQPWRQWWPPESSNFHDKAQGVILDISNDAPWMSWRFNSPKPWEKPWIHWPLNWSSAYYGHAHVEPEVIHDVGFIQKCLGVQSTHPISDFEPFRTTSIVQTFQSRPGHEQEKPYAFRVPVSKTCGFQSNFDGKWSPIMLTDVRGHEELFSLDKDGFEWLNHTSSQDILEPSFDVYSYMKEMSTFLRQHFEVQEVYIYDYVRRSHDQTDRKAGYSDVTRRIHCDQTPRSAIGRIKLHMGDRADKLLESRCRIISVWRPLVPVIEGYPLTACTFTSTRSSDMVPIDVVYPHYAEESYEIHHSLLHQWFYKSAMTPQDIMLIKLFDNKLEDDTAFYAPHGSWRDPNAKKDAPVRRSIELRCMLFG
ncbi:hypothetical protein FOWG_09907 [Fusarium oxysporum f. sp. lycopersici MN25]|nr:hypothetical protein FOWG_09907 [Fusarium oxysporum f. sp. lycopersici MN25]